MRLSMANEINSRNEQAAELEERGAPPPCLPHIPSSPDLPRVSELRLRGALAHGGCGPREL
jgi:hypothetical protein